MAIDFDKCLNKGKLRKIEPSIELALAALKEAELNLSEARSAFERKVWTWATNDAYYVMFEATRALLFMKGYNLNSPLGAIPCTKVQGFNAPRFARRVQGMEKCAHPRTEVRGFRRHFFIKKFTATDVC